MMKHGQTCGTKVEESDAVVVFILLQLIQTTRAPERIRMIIFNTFKLPILQPSRLQRQFSSEAASKQRISLALYRQLLRWCNETETDIPLSYFVPPVYMAPPQIDENVLKGLTETDKSKFPSNSIIEGNQITCPIHNSSDAKDFFRAIFRLNRTPATDAEVQKQRISLAFEGIRSLNELSQALQTLKKNRSKHVLRDGVEFRIGQVVKHKVEDWRGIVIGWERIDSDSAEKASQASSLTKKSYALDPADTIKYKVLLDSGDAHAHYSKRRETNNLSEAKVNQSDLQLVEDERYVVFLPYTRIYRWFLIAELLFSLLKSAADTKYKNDTFLQPVRLCNTHVCGE